MLRRFPLLLVGLFVALSGCGVENLDADAVFAEDAASPSADSEPDRVFDGDEVALAEALAGDHGVEEAGGPRPPAVFIVPHQDDELLTMGGGLVEHINAGREVWIVLVTDGANHHSARANLCSQGGVCLTKQQFTEARNREFLAAMSSLGIPHHRVRMLNKPDGGLTRAMAHQIVDDVIAEFGANASIKTMSWLDRHNDHAHLGHALNSRSKNGSAKDARFYQFDSYRGQVPLPWGKPVDPASFDREVVTEAGEEYRYVNKAQGRYGIGAIWSVPHHFKRFFEGKTHFQWHLDGFHWRSDADRIAGDQWLTNR